MYFLNDFLDNCYSCLFIVREPMLLCDFPYLLWGKMWGPSCLSNFFFPYKTHLRSLLDKTQVSDYLFHCFYLQGRTESLMVPGGLAIHTSGSAKKFPLGLLYCKSIEDSTHFSNRNLGPCVPSLKGSTKGIAQPSSLIVNNHPCPGVQPWH